VFKQAFCFENSLNYLEKWSKRVSSNRATSAAISTTSRPATSEKSNSTSQEIAQACLDRLITATLQAPAPVEVSF
jgi:hypothetical protein